MNDMLKSEVVRNAFVAANIKHTTAEISNGMTAIYIRDVRFYFDEHGNYVDHCIGERKKDGSS
jgi:hypothetical protein